MAVKLDVLVNYIFKDSEIKKNLARINNMMLKSNISSRSAGGAGFDYLKNVFENSKQGIQHFNSVLKNTIATINKLNKGGYFSDFIDPNNRGRRINLNKAEVQRLGQIFASKQISDQAKSIELKELAFTNNLKNFMAFEKDLFQNNLKQIEKENEQYDKNVKNMLEITKAAYKEDLKKKNLEDKLDMDEIDRQSKADSERYEEQKKLEKQKKKDEEDLKKQRQKEQKENERKRHKQLMMFFGKFGIYSFVINRILQGVSTLGRFVNAQAQQGLDWQRTISGGASGGSFFGQGLAAYQAAGISGNQYQGFKRGLQSYIGSVKLGQGNAAPLMYLGLSALDNLDNLETELKHSLRRLPKETSLALAQQMGLNYEMWEAIYSGRIDKYSNLKYDKEAIEKWAEVADRINYMITWLQTQIFNKLAEPTSEFIKLLNADKNSSIIDMLTKTIPFKFNPYYNYEGKESVKNISIVVNGTTELTNAVKDAIIQIF